MLDELRSVHARLGAVVGSEGLARLHRARVAVIGAGLLGGQLLMHLAMLQIRALIVDCGVVDPPNLGNQLLPAEALGEPKACVRVAQMRALNPSSPAMAVAARVEDLGLGIFADCDLLLTGLDSRASRLATCRIAQHLGIDWIDAAVDGSGERLLGTVSWFRPADDAAPCYACRFDAAALAAVAREARRQPCASWRDPAATDTPPTLVASPFGAVVAGLQMLWAVEALQGRGQALVGRQLQVAGAGAARVRCVALARSRRCAFSHRRLEPLNHSDAPTLGALLARAERALGSRPTALQLPGRPLAFGLDCPLCGGRWETVRWVRAVRDDEIRCACGGTRVPRALGDRIDAERFDAVTPLRWEALGLPEQDLVSAIGPGGEAIHYLLARRKASQAESAVAQEVA